MRKRGTSEDVANRLRRIQYLADKEPPESIAKELGITLHYLKCICSTNKISLTVALPTAPSESENMKQLEAASKLLREHGWTVVRPDPFLDVRRRVAA